MQIKIRAVFNRFKLPTDLKQEMKVRVTGNTTSTTEKPPTRKSMVISSFCPATE